MNVKDHIHLSNIVIIIITALKAFCEWVTVWNLKLVKFLPIHKKIHHITLFSGL